MSGNGPGNKKLAVPTWPVLSKKSGTLMRPLVLVVDDSDLYRQRLCIWLKAAGFSTLEAKNGVHGLGILKDNPRVNLAFIDVNMPEMSGVDMVEALKKHWDDNPETAGKHPHLVMLTAESTLDLVHRAKGVGVVGWIIKPAKEEIIISTAARLTGFQALGLQKTLG